MRHTEGTMAAKEKLDKQIEQLSAPMIQLDSEVLKGKDAMVDFMKLKETEKLEIELAYEEGGLQAHSEQSPRKLDKVDCSISCVQGTIDRFSVGQNKDIEYMERLADEKSRQM